MASNEPQLTYRIQYFDHLGTIEEVFYGFCRANPLIKLPGATSLVAVQNEDSEHSYDLWWIESNNPGWLKELERYYRWGGDEWVFNILFDANGTRHEELNFKVFDPAN